MEFLQNQLMCREAVAENAAQKIHCTSEDGRKANHPRDVPKPLRYKAQQAARSSAFLPLWTALCRCLLFKKPSLSRKKQMLVKAGRYFGCLTKGHMAKQCRSKPKCGKYSKKHVTSACALDRTKSDEGNVTSTPVNLVSKQARLAMLLQTPIDKIARTPTSGRYRGLFNGGSPQSFIIASAAHRLRCELQKQTLTVSMFGGQHTRNTMKKVRALFFSADNKPPISGKAIK